MFSQVPTTNETVTVTTRKINMRRCITANRQHPKVRALELPRVLEYSSTTRPRVLEYYSSSSSKLIFYSSTHYFTYPIANCHFRLQFLQSLDELLEFIEKWGFVISFATRQPGNKSEYIQYM